MWRMAPRKWYTSVNDTANFAGMARNGEEPSVDISSTGMVGSMHAIAPTPPHPTESSTPQTRIVIEESATTGNA